MIKCNFLNTVGEMLMIKMTITWNNKDEVMEQEL